MSPRKIDPDTRTALIDTAARLLAEEGPTALSARSLATATGTSTMSIYTHFGSMSELVREVVREGFGRLSDMFGGLQPTEDAVADMAYLGRTYRSNATTNRHLYTVMFGDASLAGFELTDEDRQYGRYTMSPAIDCARRCLEVERFRNADPVIVAHHMWLAIHGTITLELGGYLVAPWDADLCFETQLITLMIGAGDEPALAQASVAASAVRLTQWQLASAAPPVGG